MAKKSHFAHCRSISAPQNGQSQEGTVPIDRRRTRGAGGGMARCRRDAACFSAGVHAFQRSVIGSGTVVVGREQVAVKAGYRPDVMLGDSC